MLFKNVKNLDQETRYRLYNIKYIINCLLSLSSSIIFAYLSISKAIMILTNTNKETGLAIFIISLAILILSMLVGILTLYYLIHIDISNGYGDAYLRITGKDLK